MAKQWPALFNEGLAPIIERYPFLADDPLVDAEVRAITNALTDGNDSAIPLWGVLARPDPGNATKGISSFHASAWLRSPGEDFARVATAIKRAVHSVRNASAADYSKASAYNAVVAWMLGDMTRMFYVAFVQAVERDSISPPAQPSTLTVVR